MINKHGFFIALSVLFFWIFIGAVLSVPLTYAADVQTGGVLNIISPYKPSSFGYPPERRGFAPVFAMQPCFEAFTECT